MIEVRWTRKAHKQLLCVDKRYQQTIKDKVGALKDFPMVAMDFKKLSGSDNRFRLRVGHTGLFLILKMVILLYWK